MKNPLCLEPELPALEKKCCTILFFLSGLGNEEFQDSFTHQTLNFAACYALVLVYLISTYYIFPPVDQTSLNIENVLTSSQFLDGCEGRRVQQTRQF